MKPGRLGAGLAGSLVLVVVLASSGAAYHVAYEYSCYATHSDGIRIADAATLTGQTFVQGDYTKAGDFGNYGSAAFLADISTATVSASSHGHGVETGPNAFAVGDGRVDEIEIWERLFFTVPAGDYPNGVQVRLFGRALGSISSDVGAGAEARCYASFGPQIFDTTLLGVYVEESGTIVVDEVFILTQELVAPGTTLPSPTEFPVLLVLRVFRAWAWASEYNPGGGYVTGDGDDDFVNGMRVVALSVPPGVSWTSESGVFPTLPTAAPEVPFAALTPRLQPNFPNPFRPLTTIRYELPDPATVQLSIFDVAGRRVRLLVEEEARPAGASQVVWRGLDDRGRRLPAGTYFYRLVAGNFVETRKAVMVR